MPTIPSSVAVIDAIVIGASAGGIDALLQLFDQLPATFRLPIIVVIHLRDDRASRLAELFAQRVCLPVEQAEDKASVKDGTIYFAGPGYHLSIEMDRSFSLSNEEPVHFSRPAIDHLMTSAADAYGSRLAGILLTGANEDGAAGMRSITQAGGITIVQDPAEAQIAVMPQAAITLCPPTHILPLKDIRQHLLELGMSDA